MGLFDAFLKFSPEGLSKSGQNSLGKSILGEKTWGRFDRFDPTGAQMQSFGHDANLGDNVLAGGRVSDHFRQRGREDMFGLRAREVGAGALAALGGYYAAPYFAGGAAGGAAPTAGAAPIAGATSGGVGYSTAGTAGAGAGSTAPAWSQWLRSPQQQQQRPQQYQPNMHMIEEDPQRLAQLLRSY